MIEEIKPIPRSNGKNTNTNFAAQEHFVAATHAPIELTPSGPAANPQHEVPPAGAHYLLKMVPG